MLQGEQVPASEKLVSLVEPHTAIIRKGKAGKPVEFGRVVWLGEVEGGIISEYQVLAGNPADVALFDADSPEHAVAEIARPIAVFKNGVQTVRWHAPELLRP